MAIASARRPAASRPRRVERRRRRRTRGAAARWIAGVGAWAAVFLGLSWLVAAGFYGLLVNG